MKDTLLYIKFAISFAVENQTLSHIKQFGRWHKDTRSKESTLSREQPWITYDAIDHFEKIINKDMRLFEWGSGGSTLFFAKRCKEVVTIEHDGQWHDFLTEKLKGLSIKNVTLKKIKPEKVGNLSDQSPLNPDDFLSYDKKSQGLSFEPYVKAIDEYGPGYFDIIVVDGRARNSCIKRAIPHLKKDGYLVVDNSERKYYLSSFPELQDKNRWQKDEFQGPIFFQHAFSRTSFFRKR